MIKSKPIAVGIYEVNGEIIQAPTHAQAVRKYRNKLRNEFIFAVTLTSVIIAGLVVTLYYVV